MDRPRLWVIAMVTGDAGKPETINVGLAHQFAPNESMAVALAVSTHYQNNPAHALLSLAVVELTRGMVAGTLELMDRPPAPEPQKVVQLVPQRLLHTWDNMNSLDRRCIACGLADGGNTGPDSPACPGPDPYAEDRKTLNP